jgi:hypothetical protein
MKIITGLSLWGYLLFIVEYGKVNLEFGILEFGILHGSLSYFIYLFALRSAFFLSRSAFFLSRSAFLS